MAETGNTPPVNHPEISKESRKSVTNAIIELFELDLSPYGLGLFCFTTSYKEYGKPVSFNGRQYIATPIIAEGFEFTSEGSAPTAMPTLKVGIYNKITAAMILNNNDLIGCNVTRIKTFANFLDDGATPNPAARFQEDRYTISRRSKLNEYYCEFELTSIVNFEGQQLPRTQVIKRYCSYIYRFYSGNKFVYDDCYPCPYRATKYFDEKGNATTKEKDKCDKQLSGCIARYGRDAVLPFQGFPSVNRQSG